jgi:hypothetical protein
VFLQIQAENHWQRAIVGALDDKTDFAQSLQGNAWIYATCADVVSGCYTLGGSSVVFNASLAFARFSRREATCNMSSPSSFMRAPAHMCSAFPRSIRFRDNSAA